jgi:hypothetical protein
MTRKLGSGLAVLAVASALLTGVAGPAHAAAVDLSCIASNRTTYSPGVTLRPSLQTMHVTSTVSSCVSVSNPAIKSSSVSFSFQGVRSCLDIDQTTSGTSRITWNTGETTVYTYSSTTATVAGQVVNTISGRVVSGPFSGGTITTVGVSPVVNLLQCLFPPGITSRSSTGVLTITGSR